jgi:hypothetical protein
MTWEGLNVDPLRQLDMDSLRYSLAFLAYATSGLTYQHTPAYREATLPLLPSPHPLAYATHPLAVSRLLPRCSVTSFREWSSLSPGSTGQEEPSAECRGRNSAPTMRRRCAPW